MIQKTLRQGYVIDTSAFIDMWRNMAPDIFETLWQKDLEKIIREKLLIAPQEVLRELQRRDDDLLAWAKSHRDMFVDLNKDKEQVRYVKRILSRYSTLIDSKKTTPDADPFVIGLAISRGWTVITSEKYRKGKINVPYVCREENVECIDILGFLRNMGWKY